MRYESFNPRTRVGCDPADIADQHKQLEVSIHAPAWGATLQGEVVPNPWPGFNPRTRVGCDYDEIVMLDEEEGVSIHAPAWGATALFKGLTIITFWRIICSIPLISDFSKNMGENNFNFRLNGTDSAR